MLRSLNPELPALPIDPLPVGSGLFIHGDFAHRHALKCALFGDC